MADIREYERIKVSALPESAETEGLYALGVSAEGESVKVPIGGIFDELRRSIAALETTTKAQSATINTLSAENQQLKATLTKLQAKEAEDVSNLQTSLEAEVALRKQADSNLTAALNAEIERAEKVEANLEETKADAYDYITDDMINNELN